MRQSSTPRYKLMPKAIPCTNFRENRNEKLPRWPEKIRTSIMSDCKREKKKSKLVRLYGSTWRENWGKPACVHVLGTGQYGFL